MQQWTKKSLWRHLAKDKLKGKLCTKMRGTKIVASSSKLALTRFTHTFSKRWSSGPVASFLSTSSEQQSWTNSKMFWYNLRTLSTLCMRFRLDAASRAKLQQLFASKNTCRPWVIWLPPSRLYSLLICSYPPTWLAPKFLCLASESVVFNKPW